MDLTGAENETRTRDPNLGKVVLYQLSYFRLVFIANAKVMLFPKLTKLFNDFFKLNEINVSVHTVTVVFVYEGFV